MKSEEASEVASEEAIVVASEVKEEKVAFTATDLRVIDPPDAKATSKEEEVAREEVVTLPAMLPVEPPVVLPVVLPVVEVLPKPPPSDHYQFF